MVAEMTHLVVPETKLGSLFWAFQQGLLILCQKKRPTSWMYEYVHNVWGAR
jgi:hypothetical protein